MTVNNEDYQESIKLGLKYLKHFHISEDFLGEVGKGKVDHQKIADLLKECNYDGWVSVEMPKKDGETNNLVKIERVLRLVERIYR
jgi:sugar phosphate isomerase/epimerase